MADLVNLGTPQVLSRGAVALAIEAGIEAVIDSILSGLAMDKISLLVALKDTLAVSNPALAAALNIDYLDAIVKYIGGQANASFMYAGDLPDLLDEAGPVEVTAYREPTLLSQINIGYSEPPSGYTGEIYLDGVFVKHSTIAAVGGIVNDIIEDVAAGAHTIRVLYRDPDGNITRFGELVEIAS